MIIYIAVALLGEILTLILLWPLEYKVMLLAAPVGGSFCALLTAIPLYLRTSE